MAEIVRSGRWVCGLVAALLPAAAHAGPISWSYRSHVVGESGAGYLNLGTIVHRYDDGTQYVSVPYVAITPINSFDEPPVLLGGPQQLMLGGISYPHLLKPNDPRILAADDSFRLTLDITDDASGETGTAFFTGNGYVMDGVFTTGTGVVGLNVHGNTELRLGDNLYQIHAGTKDSESEAYMIADVTVAPAVRDTPEPATLILAGLGVAGAVAARLRRRSPTSFLTP